MQNDPVELSESEALEIADVLRDFASRIQGLQRLHYINLSPLMKSLKDAHNESCS